MTLQDFIYDQIPLSKHLGVKIFKIDDLEAIVTAPLDINRNHMNTAFGGSLQAILVLSAYAWLFQIMKQKGYSCHVVLQESSYEFLKPVSEDIKAICRAPKGTQLQKFLNTFAKKKKARITLHAAVEDKCVFIGKFVVQTSSHTNLI